MTNPQSSKPNKSGKNTSQYIRFTGIAFEMLAFILIGYWLGGKANDYYALEAPILTLIGILLGVGGSMYNLIRKLPKD